MVVVDPLNYFFLIPHPIRGPQAENFKISQPAFGFAQHQATEVEGDARNDCSLSLLRRHALTAKDLTFFSG